MSERSEPASALGRWMSPSELFYVYRARMRARQTVVQEVLVVLGIAVGVALLFASQVASASLSGSVQQLSSQLIGSSQYQVQSRGPTGFRSGLVQRIERVPGVVHVLPVLDEPASLVGPGGRQQAVDLLGVSPQWARSGGSLLRRFSPQQLEHQQALALPRPLAETLDVGPFQDLTVQVQGRSVRALVGATVGEKEIGDLVNSAVAVAPISYAQMLTGMSGRLTRVFVQVGPRHASQARAALQRLAAAHEANLEPADSEATQFRVAAGPQNQSEGLFSAISALVGFMFAFNAILLTISSRRNLIEALRLRGCTRAMTCQLLICEALLLGAAACVVGVGLGELLSIAVFHSSPGYLAFAFPVGSPRIVTWQTIAISLAAGFAAALFGVLAPLRDVVKPTLSVTRPLRGWAPVRLAAGLGGLAVTTAIVIYRPQSAVVGMCTLMLALICLLPPLFDRALASFAALMGTVPFASASPQLATVELRDPATRVRSLAVAATAAIAVFGAVSIQGSKHNLEEGLNRTANEVNDITSVWVSAPGQANALGTTPFDATSTMARVRKLPQAGHVSLYRGGFLTIGDRRAWVLAPPLSGRFSLSARQIVAGSSRLATRRLRAGGWAVLSEALAKELHLRVGETFVLPSPHPGRLRVAALSTNMGWPPGAITISSNQYARLWGSGQAAALNVEPANGASPATLRRAIARALGPDSSLAVQTAEGRDHLWQTIGAQGLSRLSQIAALAIIAAVLAIAGVMGSMIWQRKPHLAYIKRQGYTRGILWRTLLWECVLLVLTGCVVGGAFGLYGELVLSHALVVVTGFPVIVGVGFTIPLVVIAVVCLAALVILAVPGYLAVRVRASVTSPA